MTLYLIKSTLRLAAVLGIYLLFLERESMHPFKRFYLLAGLVFSFMIPLFAIGHAEILDNSNTGGRYIWEVMSRGGAAPSESSHMSIYYLVQVIYLLVAITLFVRFSVQLVARIGKALRHRNVRLENTTLVLLDQRVVPYIFWNFIFINKTDYQNYVIEPELLTQELTHSPRHTPLM